MQSEKTQLIKLEDINGSQIVDVSKWEKLQNEIVKENPFIEISDTATYNQAKSNRTALLKGRTSLIGANGQQGIIRSTLKAIQNNAIEVLGELANITEPYYEKQQDEVKRYESIIEEKRLERLKKAEEERLLEEKRIQDINDVISAVFSEYKTKISEMTFDSIEEIKKDIWDNLKERNVEEFEEFEVTYYSTVNHIEELLNESIQSLTTTENQRLENLRLADERKKFEEEKAITRAEERKRQNIIDAENKKIEAANQKKFDELAKESAKVQAEKDRLQKIEDTRIAKELKAKETKERIAREKKEAKRLKALQPDKVKALERIDSLQITIENTVKDSEVKELLNQFEVGVNMLKNEYTNLVNNLT